MVVNLIKAIDGIGKARLGWFIAGLVFLIAAASIPPAAYASEAAEIKIIGTNDIHTYLRPIYYRYLDNMRPWGPQSAEGDYLAKADMEGKLGGMAHVATVIRKLRAEKPGATLLVDAGDTWH